MSEVRFCNCSQNMAIQQIMTDKKNSRQNVPEDEDTSERHSHVTGTNTASDSGGEGETEMDRPDGEITLAIEQIEISNTNEQVQIPTSPRPISELERSNDLSTDKISLERISHSISKSRTPKSTLELPDSKLVPYRVSVRRRTETTTEQSSSSPQKQAQQTNRGQTVSEQEITVTRLRERVDHESQPQSSQLTPVAGNQQLLDELEDSDPVFRWGGGMPYSNDRPVCIVHRETESVPSFEFLQRSLRDAYSELRGGEPSVKHAEFVANELRIPEVSGSIVTLDVSGDEWSPSQTNDRPAIEYAGVDIVPDLVNQVKDLYSGGLGYFLINVPQRWENSIRFGDFSQNLVEHLTAATLPGDEVPTGILEKLQSAPVSIATPYVTEMDAFDDRISHYYAFDGRPESWESIAQADSAFQRLLRSGRWTQVILTERQAAGEESDQHYNWKGLLIEGLALALWQKTDPEIPFNTFVRETLLEKDALKSEHELNDQESPVADIYLDTTLDHTDEALRKFLLGEEGESIEVGLPAAFEFETGFSEGAFQYRKMIESIEKYRGQMDSVSSIYLIIPPRILYRGKKQAQLVLDLVTTEATQFDESTVELCIPVLESGRCIGLRRAEPLIDALYD
ncbi:hypothetical protein [Natranaeroarchaeum aerophilus]|uniref:Uncharacterized protein n=1 Tax=Natranaeroarchaeum aerophilus TaxID=2917711 RepID=A0AAE3K8H9_9EURY|nr:hypothetical protein [Natranaeroarchaeum aerophilus]MCL9814979.1 hypothetical protein [Natranaeroarchaeum aerophilus]